MRNDTIMDNSDGKLIEFRCNGRTTLVLVVKVYIINIIIK